MMYWQVYMHKTVIAAENVLAAVMKRARELANEGREIYTTPWLGWFLKRNITGVDISGKGSYDPREIACNFARLDDSDVLHCIKMWMDHPDRVLSMLSGSLMLRNLPAVELSNGCRNWGTVQSGCSQLNLPLPVILSLRERSQTGPTYLMICRLEYC
jgi:HD superfamily phosphohydrolase